MKAVWSMGQLLMQYLREINGWQIQYQTFQVSMVTPEWHPHCYMAQHRNALEYHRNFEGLAHVGSDTDWHSRN